MQQMIIIDDELLNNATHCLAMDDINEIVNIALRELIQNHPVSNNKQQSFNPKQFFAVSHLKDIDKQLEEMRNEWER
jgi:hypothetical protein